MTEQASLTFFVLQGARIWAKLYMYKEIHAYICKCTYVWYVCMYIHTLLYTYTCKQIKIKVHDKWLKLDNNKGEQKAVKWQLENETRKPSSLQTFIIRSCWCSKGSEWGGAYWGKRVMGGQSKKEQKTISAWCLNSRKRQLRRWIVSQVKGPKSVFLLCVQQSSRFLRSLRCEFSSCCANSKKHTSEFESLVCGISPNSQKACCKWC